MTIEKTIDVPASRKVTIEIPQEIPLGKVTLTFSPPAENKETSYTVLSKESAVSMAAEVIEKYRPALEELAK
ncbi:MAG: hypothetical protein FWG66_13345 [Spirochaetes bacterium]|nr:hypothetical protein [Spirochaetota bacterium]